MILKLGPEKTLLKKIGEIADQEKVLVFAVGGYVRDLLLGRPCIDLDFMVIGDGPKFAQSVAHKLKVKNIIVYSRFQTAVVPYREYKLEFVGARSENYQASSRNPEVEAADFSADILRRDFTINALAMGLNKENFGVLIDQLQGVKDLENKIIRTPKDPELTFSDDPLRIMRAIRFACQLNFSIEEKTMAGLIKTVARLKIISLERISNEFLKILSCAKPSNGLWLLYNSGALSVFLPELSALYGIEELEGKQHKNILAHTFTVVDKVAEASDYLPLRLAALFHDIGKLPTKEFAPQKGWTFYNHEYAGAKMLPEIFYRLRLPNAYLKYVKKLVRQHMRPCALAEKEVTDSAIRRLIVLGAEELEDLLLLAQKDLTSHNPLRIKEKKAKLEYVCERVKQVKEIDQLRAFQSPVRGEEIMKLASLDPGPAVGKIKKQIEEAILNGDIPNEYEAAKQYLQEKILKR